MAREDSGGQLRCRPGSGHDLGRRAGWAGSSRSDTDTSVVPVSLQVSIVMEGFHGDRGWLPSSTGVRLLDLPCPRGGHLLIIRRVEERI